MQDPLAALAADLGSPAEVLAHSPSFHGGKEMWCTPSLLSAAGRRCYRLGGRFVAAPSPPAGAEEAAVYDFIPVRLQVDDQGKLTTIELGAAGSNLRVIHLADPGLYVQAMNDCLSINQLCNRLAEAHTTLFKARKVEDYQSVGMKCRECLLFLVEGLAKPEMVPSGEAAPKRGDFIHWCELIANNIAAGSTSESIGTYLKQVSKTTWQLVNWLTHSHHAGKLDGALATEATENVMQTFMVAWARFEELKQVAKRRRRRGKPPAKTE
jgi:hypothetical protein